MTQTGMTGDVLRLAEFRKAKISAIEVGPDHGPDDGLRIAFDDGSALVLHDDDRQCCEHRYMTCDDDLQAFIGASLWGVSVRDAEPVEDDWGTHEIAFLVVDTSKGSFTVETHNEHNGYYGGMNVRVVAERRPEWPGMPALPHALD